MTEIETGKTSPESAMTMPVVQLLELGAHFVLAERVAKMGYWRHEAGAKYPTWSPGFYALLGIDPRDVKPSARWLMDRMHPDDRDEVAAKFTNAMTNGVPFSYRTRGFRPNGDIHIYDTHGDVERGSDGRIVAIIGVVHDVTARIAAEQALKESEAAYRFLADEATDIITRHGQDGLPVFISPAIGQVLGYEPAACLSMAPFQLCHPDDVKVAKAAVTEARQSRQTVTYEHRSRHKDGRYVWLESRVRFVSDNATGEAHGAISVTRDITARKQFEDELQSARERAEAESATKSRFLANMSHELRTPLNAIIGFSDILAREMFGPVGPRYVEYAQLINNSGAMLLDLINDLLDMSKIEAGKFELYYEEVAIEETVAGCLQLLAQRAKDGGVEIVTRVTPGDLRLRADKRAFGQILINLLSNAVKFSNRGGKITVDAQASGATLRLKICDNGVGIPKDVLPRLARPFEQASNDPTRAHGGTGLGLALVKSLTQLHGGEFAIDSEVGKGTQVTVILPLAPATATVRAAI